MMGAFMSGHELARQCRAMSGTKAHSKNTIPRRAAVLGKVGRAGDFHFRSASHHVKLIAGSHSLCFAPFIL